MTKYELVDAEERHAANPDTFEIPSDEVKEALTVGDVVKLIFDGSERMWVCITSRSGNRFHGWLDNTPYVVVGLNYKDPIEFEARHIIDVQ